MPKAKSRTTDDDHDGEQARTALHPAPSTPAIGDPVAYPPECAIPKDYRLDKDHRKLECFAILHALGLPLADCYWFSGHGLPGSKRQTRSGAAWKIKQNPYVAERIRIYSKALAAKGLLSESRGDDEAVKINASDALVIASEIARNPANKPAERMAALNMAIKLADLAGKAAPPPGKDDDAKAGPRPGDKDWSKNLNIGAQAAIARLTKRATDNQSVVSEASDDDDTTKTPDIPIFGARRQQQPATPPDITEEIDGHGFEFDGFE